jgi:hypothetical protein
VILRVGGEAGSLADTLGIVMNRKSGKYKTDFFPSFPPFLLHRAVGFGIAALRLAPVLLLVPLFVSLAGCGTRATSSAAPPPSSPTGGGVLADDALVPSPRLIVGRIIAVDPARGFAFVELAADAPASALTEGTELIVRTPDLREKARLKTSRHLRGRTLGTNVVGGQPSPDDEVVWLAP